MGAHPEQVAGDLDEEYFLYERYARRERRSRALAAYYAVKPLVPRSVQLALRRRLARRQSRAAFPAWPIEPVLVRRRAATLRAELAAKGEKRKPFVNFWPRGQRFAVVLTHDVEGPLGLRRVPEVLEIEQRHGFVSSWNFVAERYPVAEPDLEAVRTAGCEVGLHGIKHDGRLFQDRAHFDADLPKIHRYLEAWGAVGFRSPATVRNADWIHELPCLYDSSFPDTDPFQPQPGGCCSIFPFFFGDVVELPITLDQDHTLFELLRQRSIALWMRKSNWIIEHHGLVNVIVHPDYMTPERLALYGQFLAFLREQDGAWHALPREVAAWWRTRAGLRCVTGEGADETRVEGEGADEATVAWAWPEGDRVAYEL